MTLESHLSYRDQLAERLLRQRTILLTGLAIDVTNEVSIAHLSCRAPAARRDRSGDSPRLHLADFL